MLSPEKGMQIDANPFPETHVFALATNPVAETNGYYATPTLPL